MSCQILELLLLKTLLPLDLGNVENNAVAYTTDIIARNVTDRYVTPTNTHNALDAMLNYDSGLGLPYDTLSSYGVRHIDDELLKRINVVENVDRILYLIKLQT